MAKRLAPATQMPAGARDAAPGLTSWGPLAWIGLIFVSMVASAAGQTEPGDPTSKEGFVVNTVNGAPVTGRWTQLHDGGKSLTIEVGGASQTFDAADIVVLSSVAHETGSRPPQAGSPVVLLAGGDRLYGIIDNASEDALAVSSPLFGRVMIPWQAVQAVVLRPPDGETAQHRLLRRLVDHAQPHDLIVIQNGDTLTGTLLGIDKAQVRVESGGRLLAAARQSVVAVAMNPELVERRRFQRLHAVVVGSDGSRLTVQPVALDEGWLHLKSSFGTTLRMELRHLLSLRFLGGHVVYLSDLQPASYRHVPYLSLRWPWVRDASVGRRPMRLGSRLVTKGLGVHSRSELTYDLAGTYRRFDATVGIDDETQGHGSVVFRVLVDGRERFTSAVVRGNDPAMPLDSIDVTGAQRLTLVVDFADRGDVQDHADWAYARLLK